MSSTDQTFLATMSRNFVGFFYCNSKHFSEIHTLNGHLKQNENEIVLNLA